MSEAQDDQVIFTVFDLSDHADEEKRGFYFHIPLGEEETDEEREQSLDGPYPTKERATQAALDFIEDALSTFGPINSGE